MRSFRDFFAHFLPLLLFLVLTVLFYAGKLVAPPEARAAVFSLSIPMTLLLRDVFRKGKNNR